MEAPLQRTALILPYTARMLGIKPVNAADKACAVLDWLCQTDSGNYGVRIWP
jgi:hypothetical protein